MKPTPFTGGRMSLMILLLNDSRLNGRNVERDILFAARDIVIGMRSGMPLYNAIAAVSTGYGDASREFGKPHRRTENR